MYLPGEHALVREERDPRQTDVVSVDEHVLHDDIRRAGMIEEASDIAAFFRVDYEETVVAEIRVHVEGRGAGRAC